MAGLGKSHFGSGTGGQSEFLMPKTKYVQQFKLACTICHCKSEVTSGEVRKQKPASQLEPLSPFKSCMIRNEKATVISASYTSKNVL